MKCKVCGTTSDVRLYVIADDMENPQPYCKDCMNIFLLELLKKISFAEK